MPLFFQEQFFDDPERGGETGFIQHRFEANQATAQPRRTTGLARSNELKPVLMERKAMVHT